MIGNVEHFVDDDSAYLAWLADHPSGYVINTGRTPSAAYLMLHRADCHAIAGVAARGSTFTGDYSKVCGSQEELQAFATELGGSAKPCGMCMARQRRPRDEVPSGSRYSPLRSYLAGRGGNEVRMTFAEVEELVGRLPDSARLHRAWWSNSSHVARAWQEAGWHLQSVSQAAEQVVFVRGATFRPSHGGNEDHVAQRAYVDAQVIAAIRAHHAPGRFDWAKLLRLIDELNDNYARGSTYAVHAVLRAILDHIPPLLGCSTFMAAVNNYPWSRTDKAYMKRLLDFRLQADDAMHRQISAQTDLLSPDDIPPRAWINRLLQECVSPSESHKAARQDQPAAAGPGQRSQDIASRPRAAPRQASASLLTRSSASQERAERIVIRLTHGGLKNSYVSLAKHLDFFPPTAIGAAKLQDGEGALLTLHFAGLSETVETDIDGRHTFFRRRDPWRKFFAYHRLVEGDSVAIERLSTYEYRIVPLVQREAGQRSSPHVSSPG
jgi:hypothetical protein